MLIPGSVTAERFKHSGLPKMAKRPPRKKLSLTDGYLTSALAQLSLINEACDDALPQIWDAIMAMVVVPATTTYEFTIAGDLYEATLSVYQWTKISDAIKANDDVLDVVAGLLSDLTRQLSASACGLVDAINGEAWPAVKAITKSPLGCCAFDNQQIPLTQVQCSQYTNSTWNPDDPDCTGGKPRSKGK
jgi:hypothetical protein